jgi:uncharacterized protein HemY
MRPLIAHCHHGLGQLYATMGQRKQAHSALCRAIDLYREMEMAFWLPQAESALAEVARSLSVTRDGSIAQSWSPSPLCGGGIEGGHNKVDPPEGEYLIR